MQETRRRITRGSLNSLPLKSENGKADDGTSISPRKPRKRPLISIPCSSWSSVCWTTSSAAAIIFLLLLQSRGGPNATSGANTSVLPPQQSRDVRDKNEPRVPVQPQLQPQPQPQPQPQLQPQPQPQLQPQPVIPQPQPQQQSARTHNKRRPPNAVPPLSTGPQDEQQFAEWCKLVLGIETVLEIQTFEYYDYVKGLSGEDWDDDEDDDKVQKSRITPLAQLPKVSVRGLAASRDIAEGEVVIRIPLQALFSVTTTIDQDPVLGPVMGPEARQKHGWKLDATHGGSDASHGLIAVGDTENEEPLSTLLEIPLLAVALLHHRRLGASSSLAPYLGILSSASVESMPFLWNGTQLKTLSEGIRTVARGVKLEMKSMYERVVRVLIAEHPHLFDNEAFNYDSFQWAFAVVNSRHWQLPVADMQAPAIRGAAASAGHEQPQHQQLRLMEDATDQLPPADTPTDAWVAQQQLQEQADNPHATGSGSGGGSSSSAPAHSFLAPFADLLNFGPPCTRGNYNPDSHTFEIVASCSFRKGQEVTFWYSDECDHVMVGLYGFTHPMVPPCPSAEDYRRSAEEWRSRAEELEQVLWETHLELDRLDVETAVLEKHLKDCGCQAYNKHRRRSRDDDKVRHAAEQGPTAAAPSRLRHEHVRGGFTERQDLERRGVRKVTRGERNSEF